MTLPCPSPLSRRRAGACALALAGAFVAASYSSGGPTAAAATPARPKLVVFLVVDGLPMRQVTGYRAQLAPGGFARFLDRGAWFSDAHYGHSYTVTATGHATMLSGAYPHRSGIIGNEWRDVNTGERVYCTGDTSASYIGHKTEKLDGTSPKNLLVEPEGIEDRHRPLDECLVAADHQAVPVGQAPDAAGDAAVQVADPGLGQSLGVHEVIGESRVAAVNHQVTLGQQFADLFDGGSGRRARRHHHPDDARRGKGCHQVAQGGDVGGVGVPVVSRDLNPRFTQASGHVAAHAAEADKSDVHDRSLQVSLRPAPASAGIGNYCRPGHRARPEETAPQAWWAE